MAMDNGTGADVAMPAVLTDDPDCLRALVTHIIQESLATEMTAQLGAASYERTSARTGQRNGDKPRQLPTRVGTLTLLVPQDRAGTVSTQLFARDQRTEKALVLSVMALSLQGVSTRSGRARKPCAGRVSRSVRCRGWRGRLLPTWRRGAVGRAPIIASRI